MTRAEFAKEQRKKFPDMLLPIVAPEALLIWPYVKVAENVSVGPGSVIGYQGTGYTREDGEWSHIPQIGRVVIEADVHIYSGVHIQRGTVEDTVIGKGTVIGHNCSIGHNVKIGKNCMLTNGIIVSGSCVIGDNVYIAPGVIIKDHVGIADNVHIGQGSNVLRDLERSGWWYKGNPATLFREVKEGDV